MLLEQDLEQTSIFLNSRIFWTIQLNKINTVSFCQLMYLKQSRVDRDAVLDSLSKMNISGRMFDYIRNFLSNRTFKVRIGSTLSTARSTNRGVPQGSTLSVTLFLIAINPLFGTIPTDVQVLIYADHILIVAYGKQRKRLRTKIQQAAEKAIT